MTGLEISSELNEQRTKIYLLRERKVMLDSDLAKLYGVPAKQLNRQVKRNIERFPDDFMFQLTKDELQRCQIGTSNERGGRRYLPYAFTEQGVAMLSSVLNSKRAIQVNIQIMRAFTKIRQMLETHKDLKKKIDAMEKKYDHQFKVVFDALRELFEPLAKPKQRIGFHSVDLAAVRDRILEPSRSYEAVLKDLRKSGLG